MRDVIEKKWRDVQQIFADRQGRNVIAQNISPQCAQSQRPALCAPQQECPADKANNIRQPRPRGGRDLSMPSQRNPNECDRVVSEHQQDSQHKSARLAALLRGESQWNSYQRQDQAGSRQSKPPMKLDQVPSCRHFVGLACLPEQFPGLQLRGWRRFLLFCVSLRHWDRNVSLLKCRDLIFLGGSRISFMRCPVVQMKVQRLWRFAQQNPLSCQGYARCRGCAHISNENSLPDCCSSGALNIIHIKH